MATPAGLPVMFALTNPKIDEREVAIDMFDTDPSVLADRAGQTLIADKGYASAEFEARLDNYGIDLIRPARESVRQHRLARPRSSDDQQTPLRCLEAVGDPCCR